MPQHKQKKSNDNTSADKPKPRTKDDPEPDSPDLSNILFLQRTIGNHAVNQLLATQKPIITPSGRVSLQPQIQRKLMSYKAYLAESGQTANPRLMDVFNGKAGNAELGKTRNAINPQFGSMADNYVDRTNINLAYWQVTNDKSVETLTKLYNTIEFWQTMYGDTKFAQNHNSFLNGIRNITEIEIKKLIIQSNKEKKPSRNPFSSAKDALKNAKDSLISNRQDMFADESNFVTMSKMPDSLREIGMPQEYYETNFVDPFTGKQLEERLFILEMIIRLLKEASQTGNKHLEPINNALLNLVKDGVESVYMLKSFLYAHFGVVLNKIVGTDRNAHLGENLTPEEINAITAYSGGAYSTLNSTARKATPNTKDSNRDNTNKDLNTIELAVSGLNKLPKYEGLAYRGLLTPPPGFASYAYEGAVATDLGFSSASPAATGMTNFLDGFSDGPKNIVYMIQSKTASNIISLSYSPAEGEILFRPGTRFMIDKIWKHNPDGTIPEDAPVQVQMYLHSKLERVNRSGQAPKPSDATSYQTQVIMITEI